MHARIDPRDRLLALAGQQGGVLSAEQALGHGLSRASVKRLVDQGAWQRLSRGVYFLGVGAPPWMALAWAGLLIGGPPSRLGFAAAGHLWGLVDDPPESLPVLIPWSTVLKDSGCWTFPRERLGVRSERSPGAPSRTTLEDTVLDLSVGASPSEVVGFVTAAIQSRRMTARRLRDQVDQRSRLSHRKPIELDGRTHIAGRFRDQRRDNSALLDGEVTLRYGWPDVRGSA